MRNSDYVSVFLKANCDTITTLTSFKFSASKREVLRLEEKGKEYFNFSEESQQAKCDITHRKIKEILLVSEILQQSSGARLAKENDGELEGCENDKFQVS